MTKIAYDATIIVVPEYKIAYVNSPLNGCTTVKNIFMDLTGNEVEKKTKVHALFGPGRAPNGMTTTNNISLINDSYTSFCAVRNPYDRLVSFYESKWSRKGNEEKPRLYNYYKHYDWDMSFPEFTEWLMDYGMTNVEHHVMTQYDNLHVGQVDEVIRFENFTRDLKSIFRKNGINYSDIPQYGKKNRKDNYREYYKDGARERVAQLYEIDLVNLNYNF